MQVDDGLRKAGLRSTVPRLKIISVLENSDVRHMSAEDIYRQLIDMKEEIGIATVYRVLTQFEQAGLVVRHNFDSERAVYELNDESPHEHLICMSCQAVIEFENGAMVEQMKQIAKRHSFALKNHSLYLYGHCKNCAEN